MAVKDHSLDEKIIEAAKKEFLEKGYQKASLHKIAENAGTTTGALYTRYKNKDELFTSLIMPVVEQVKSKLYEIRKFYMEIQTCATPEKFLVAMQNEEKAYLDILFEYYDECVLLVCKGDGSSATQRLNELMRFKIDGTVDFFKKIATKEINSDGFSFIVEAQFKYYRLVLERGYDREATLKCMDTVKVFLEAGWRALFEQIL